MEVRETRATALEGVLKLARLIVITLSVGGIGWSVALGAPVVETSLAADPARPSTVSRARVAADQPAPALVTLEIDGLRVAAAGTTAQTVQDLLGALGVQVGPSDRLSVEPGQKLIPGMRLALDRGIPVTVVDGGQAAAGRAPRGTVAGLLAAKGIVLGALDEVDVPAGSAIVPGAVVKITRVSESQLSELAPVPYSVRTVTDPDLETGRQQIDTPGVSGEAVRMWLVRFVDGLEARRSLASEKISRAPVDEIRRIGTRPRPAPPAPAEIERIIRDAAARWGADPEQLLRVAWCESRFNPLAYNPSAGDTGLFQFIPGTWAANSVRAGYAGVSAFDAVANANTAAMMFSRSQAWQWTCK